MIEEKKSIKKNFLFEILFRIISFLIPLITIPVISRVFSPNQIGVETYIITIANYFAQFSKLGFDDYGKREISRERSSELGLRTSFWSTYSFQFLVSIITLLAYLLFSFFQSDRIYYYICAFYVLSSLFDVCWLFLGLENFKFVLLIQLFFKVVQTILILIFIDDSSDFSTYILLVSLFTVFPNFVIFSYALINYPFIKTNFIDTAKRIKPIMILGVSAFAVTISSSVDKLMLGTLLSEDKTQLGYYNQCQKITTMVTSVCQSIGTVLFPRISLLLSEGKEDESKILCHKAMKLTSLMSCAILFGIMGVSNVFVYVYFGSQYVEAGSILLTLSISILFFVYSYLIRMIYLIPRGLNKQYTFSILVGLFVNIGLNFVLIPFYGALGASIATVLSEFSVLIMELFFIRRNVKFKEYFKENIPYMLIGLIMFIGVYITSFYVGVSVLGLLTLILEGVVIYLLLTLVYINFFDKSMKESLMNSFHIKGKTK